jgi:7,8-dihydropterin-6-yl-methyl-4-(beta-D-ribofuranosyl)aminobenzene 5'-phosphate synthase
MKEQSLIIKTEKGPIVIVGCAHPGIVKIASKAKELLKDDIFFVVGGFHLEWAIGGRAERTISALKELGVRCVAPCHCGAEKSRGLFEKHFGAGYISAGAGRVITVGDLI